MTTQRKRERQRRALIHVRRRITKWTGIGQLPEDEAEKELADVKLALALSEEANLAKKGVVTT